MPWGLILLLAGASALYYWKQKPTPTAVFGTEQTDLVLGVSVQSWQEQGGGFAAKATHPDGTTSYGNAADRATAIQVATAGIAA